MDMTIGLWLDPVCHEGVWEALGPDRAHDRRAGVPTGRMTALLTKKQAEKNKIAVDGRRFIICPTAEGLHILSNEAYGFGSVAIEPGHKVGINAGSCSFTAIGTTSHTTSTPGARVRSLPVTADTSTRNPPPKSRKGVPVHTPKLWSLM